MIYSKLHSFGFGLARNIFGLMLALGLLCLAQTASASNVANYKLSISENLSVLEDPLNMHASMMAAWTTPTQLAMERNRPFLELQNTGDTDNITSFSMTVGAASQTFDWARIVKAIPGPGSSGITATLATPDTLDNHAKNDVITYNLSGFTPGSSLIFQIDIDPKTATGNPFTDYRDVLFHVAPLGATPDPDESHNSVTTVGFQDPTTSDGFTVQNQWKNMSVSYRTQIGMAFVSEYMQDHVQTFVQGVPEPSSFILAGLGVAGLAFYRRRRSS